jgi:hypothetical protein
MSFRTFIQHNFWLKLFSLLLATLIWFAIDFWIQSGRTPESPIINPATKQFLRIPVRILSKPDDPRLFKVEPSEVLLTVVGEEAVLRDLKAQNISAFVDLTKVRSLRETNQQIKLDIPSGVTVIRIEPRTANVEQISH